MRSAPLVPARSHCSRRRVSARYSRVPAFDSLTSSAFASSLLESWPWNLSSTTSRSLSGSAASASRTVARRASCSNASSQTPIAGQRLGQLATAAALTAPQLVERRVARDREQPRPGRSATTIQARPGPVEPLERKRGHILGRGSIAEQRDRVRMHVGGAFAE